MLYPPIKKQKKMKKKINLHQNWNLTHSGSISRNDLSIKQLKDILGKKCKTHKDKSNPLPANKDLHWISLDFSSLKNTISPLCKDLKNKGKEAYILLLEPDKIYIMANSLKGVFYGVQTFRQLCDDGRKREVDCQEILDWPSLAIRWVQYDVSRGQVPKISTLKKQIALLSKLKINGYCLYIEDTFQFKKHPQIGYGEDPYSAEDIKKLDAWAKAHHIDLIPAFQTLSHLHKILRIPRYAHLAETWDRQMFALSQKEIYPLISEWLSEIVPAFSSSYFNICCDEPSKLGQGLSSSFVRKKGIEKAYLDHFLWVKKEVQKYGKEILMWDDFIEHNPALIKKIPEDITLLYWIYYAQERPRDYPFCSLYGKENLSYIVCPSTQGSKHFFPRSIKARENISKFIEDGKKHKAKGVLCTDWGDGGHFHLPETNIYPYAYTAGCAWAEKTVDTDYFHSFYDQLNSCRNFSVSRITENLSQIEESLCNISSVYFPESTFQEEMPFMSWMSVKEKWERRLFFDDPVDGWYMQNALERKDLIKEVEDIVKNLEKEFSKVDNRKDILIKELDFIKDIFAYLSKKINVSLFIKKGNSTLKKKSNKEKIAFFNESIVRLAELKKGARKLASEYKKLWLARNRYSCLDFHLDRFEWLCYHYKKNIRKFKQNIKRLAI